MIRPQRRKGASNDAHEASGAERSPSEGEGAPETDVESSESVLGERGAPLGGHSLQSRASSVLAAGLMICLGVGMLAWYYGEALSRPAGVHGRAPAPLPQAPGEGMTLPSFGPITPPADAPAAPSAAPPAATSSALQSASTEPAAAVAPGSLLEPALAPAAGGLPRGDGAPSPVSPRPQSVDRRLADEVFARSSRAASALAGGNVRGQASPSAAPADGLETLLRPRVLAGTRARMLATRRLLLPKGAFIDCTLETAIDSTLPGMTTCITATDTFSADGSVVLLERGTKLIGETRGELRQGQARVFVVWTEARTPAGVLVPLDSPGTDALGRAGLEGRVNRHFWQRFGAAALVSTLAAAAQSQAQSSSRGGTLILDPTASTDVLTETLRSTVDIPPTLRVRNGARIEVLVARDVDFRSVYELRAR